MAKSNKKGFTIIEVVLVLAIAGLIFLMVFIALPALQRSQRNTRRRQDISRIMTAFTDYESNNGHMPYVGNWGFTSYPDSGASGDGISTGNPVKNFIIKYIDSSCSSDGTAQNFKGDSCGDQFKDPDGSPYILTFSAGVFENKTEEMSVTDNYSGIGFGKPYYINGQYRHTIGVFPYTKCSTIEGNIIPGQGQNQLSLVYMLEGGSYYCVDNQ